LTLKIRPVKMKQSVYLRVPNDIADLIGIDPQTEVVLNLAERDGQFLLTYCVKKPEVARSLLRARVFHQKDDEQIYPLES